MVKLSYRNALLSCVVACGLACNLSMMGFVAPAFDSSAGMLKSMHNHALEAARINSAIWHEKIASGPSASLQKQNLRKLVSLVMLLPFSADVHTGRHHAPDAKP